MVPIIYGEPDEVIREKVSKVNAIFYPGGSGDFLEMGRKIFHQVKNINDNGQFYPLWGTCQGYEYFSIYTSDLDEKVLQSFELFY